MASGLDVLLPVPHSSKKGQFHGQLHGGVRDCAFAPDGTYFPVRVLHGVCYSRFSLNASTPGQVTKQCHNCRMRVSIKLLSASRRIDPRFDYVFDPTLMSQQAREGVNNATQKALSAGTFPVLIRCICRSPMPSQHAGTCTLFLKFQCAHLGAEAA